MGKDFDARYPRFQIREHNRITIDGTAFRLVQQGADAWLLRPSDGTGLCETFTFETLNALSAAGNRRFTKVVPKDLVIGADEARLSKLVRDYAREADLTAEWSDAFSSRLIHASRRRFGRAVETIINAIEQALAEGNRTLTGTHFAEAWGMQEGCAWDENVFVRKDWASMPLDGAADEFDAARSARQRKQLDRS